MASAVIGLVLLVAFFAFPETAYIRTEPGARSDEDGSSSAPEPSSEKAAATATTTSAASTSDVERASRAPVPAARKMTYLQSLRVFHGTLTSENLFKLVVRPLGLICLPPVLWAALVEAATIGFLVAMTSNVEVAFEATYHFRSWQVGLCFVSAVVGALLGIPAGGRLGDVMADRLTRRNGGVRDPEMRLPAMIPCLVTAPLGLVLFGVGIEHRLHWIFSTIGIGLCTSPSSKGRKESKRAGGKG